MVKTLLFERLAIHIALTSSSHSNQDVAAAVAFSLLADTEMLAFSYCASDCVFGVFVAFAFSSLEKIPNLILSASFHKL